MRIRTKQLTRRESELIKRVKSAILVDGHFSIGRFVESSSEYSKRVEVIVKPGTTAITTAFEKLFNEGLIITSIANPEHKETCSFYVSDKRRWEL